MLTYSGNPARAIRIVIESQPWFAVCGMPMQEISQVIGYGVRKINIDTDLRLSYTASVRKYLKNNKSIFDMRKYNEKAIENMKSLCIEKYEYLNSIGNAKKIKPLPLEKISKLYYSK